MKESRKSKSGLESYAGITLVALVVTIIVLLILAGVAISLTIGNNGLFTRAENAANTYKRASVNEQETLNKAYDEIDKLQIDYIEMPYDGKGYKFIYDGTQGEKGIDGKNMCKDVTRRMVIR